jgi:hypothetical protein
MHRVDEGLLTHVPKEQMGQVQAPSTNHARAADASARRTRERQSAADRVSIAEAELEVARAELATSEIKARVAELSGSKPEWQTARAAVAHCEAKVQAARLAIELRKRELDLAVRREKLAQKTADLRDAEVERAKAQAVQSGDSTASHSISLTRFELQAKQHEKDVALAEKGEAAAIERVTAARREFETAQKEADRLHAGVTTTGDINE